ncbi:MAG: phosphatidylinositol-specific phospholipase C/glycerophosphodiester phosphodiesterase family protein [Bacteroidia bacterium]|nr:phosphatidylinositol-specific phospholipase C/glycerophosphodiester phosphodiesterase family protein [Bacteroidia bacterium]
MKKITFFYALLFLFLSHNVWAQTIVHSYAHSHNDYKQNKPLFLALENGFTSIEADVFVIHNKIVVSHIYPLFKKKKALEELYLKPLEQIVLSNQGRVYANDTHSVILLIDIKQNAVETYTQLKPLLEKYKAILTSVENGIVVKRAITVVLSGNKPIEILKRDSVRFCFIDQAFMSIKKDEKNEDVFPLASCKYNTILSWKGVGDVSFLEKEQLKQQVKLAHEQGKKVRLWASPENENVWKLLIECGVDLINTNKLNELNLFLTKIKSLQ